MGSKVVPNAADPNTRFLTKDLRSSKESSLLFLLRMLVDDGLAVFHWGMLWKAAAEDRIEKSIICWNFIMVCFVCGDTDARLWIMCHRNWMKTAFSIDFGLLTESF